jgi:hypothetical protein
MSTSYSFIYGNWQHNATLSAGLCIQYGLMHKMHNLRKQSAFTPSLDTALSTNRRIDGTKHALVLVNNKLSSLLYGRDQVPKTLRQNVQLACVTEWARRQIYRHLYEEDPNAWAKLPLFTKQLDFNAFNQRLG